MSDLNHHRQVSGEVNSNCFKSNSQCSTGALWLPVCKVATSFELQHAVRKGVHDAGCARVLHLPAAQCPTQKATQAGFLVATAVGVQYSQNAEQLEQLCVLLHELHAVGTPVRQPVQFTSAGEHLLLHSSNFVSFLLELICLQIKLPLELLKVLH